MKEVEEEAEDGGLHGAVGHVPAHFPGQLPEWHIKLLFIASYGRYGQLTSDNWQSLALLTISAPWGQGRLPLIWWLDRHGGASNWMVVDDGYGLG